MNNYIPFKLLFSESFGIKNEKSLSRLYTSWSCKLGM